MKVIMKATITGTRDGVDWPAVGEPVHLPDSEATAMLRAGLVGPAEPDKPETATDPKPVEKRTRRRS